MNVDKMLMRFKEMLSSLGSHAAVPGSKERFIRSYLLAWLIYLGLLSGIFLHQRVYYHNLKIDNCSQFILFNIGTIIFQVLLGAVIAVVIDFTTAFFLPTILEPRNVMRTNAMVFTVSIIAGFALSQGDASIDHGCF